MVILHHCPLFLGVGIERWMNAATSFATILPYLLQFSLSFTLYIVFWDYKSYLSWLLFCLFSFFHNTFPLFGILCQYFYVLCIFCFMYVTQLLVQARTWGNFWGSFQVCEKWGILHFYFLTSTHKFYWLTAYLYPLLFSNCLLIILSNKLLFYKPGTSSLPGGFPIYLFSANPGAAFSAHSMFPFGSLQTIIFCSYIK